MDKAKKNIFKTMLLITICYAICFVFNSIYTTMVLFGVVDTLSGTCHQQLMYKNRQRFMFL